MKEAQFQIEFGKKNKMKEKTKVCTKCNAEKPLSEYYVKKSGRFGVSSICKLCVHDRSKAWYLANLESVRIVQAAYRFINSDKRKVAYKNWKAINKDKTNAHSRKKRAESSKFRLNGNISAAISNSLKGRKNGKHWEDIVGYSLKQLKAHLEKQFTKGMTWENYGKWHIDHEIPISVFNFTKPEHKDFKKCWTLKNLQPLWAKDNLSKNNKIEKHFQPSLLL